MPRKEQKAAKGKKAQDGKSAQAYDHKGEKLLLRPNVGLQPQFKQKKPPKTYRYDPSLDPALLYCPSSNVARVNVMHWGSA
ncbi:MAG: hypothetical protein ACREJ6_02885 [Candidatus Methylomirabilis sp.]